jgi:hypothetical protein
MTDRIRLAIATPCFGGQVSSLYATSIFKLQRALRSTPEVELVIHMREADDEMSSFRDRISPDAYERAREAAVDRLIRNRLALPTIAFA